MKLLFFIVVLFISSVFCTVNLDNGLGKTPQMGWNSWNKFACSISENLIMQTIDAMVSTGLKDLGYDYVNLDDCWQASRDSTGQIVVDKNFPHGIPYLVNYAHSKGLKLGLYSDAGLKTCQGRPGSLGYEKIDATTYAKWEIDYLKYDNCYDNGTKPEVRYPPMHDALNATGRPIFFSMCEWGVDEPAKWAKALGNSWRTTGDISDSWSSMYKIITQNDKYWQYAGPGGWNDPDMLEVGNGGMTTEQYQSHFSLWCLTKAPLIIGCDVRSMSGDIFSILSNKEAIAINQDPLGVQGHLINTDSQKDVWAGPLSPKGKAWTAILLNKSIFSSAISVNFADIGIPAGSSCLVRDIWAHKDLGTFKSSFSYTVKGNTSIMVKITLA